MESDQLTDFELLSRYRFGDESCFMQLAERYAPGAFSCALSLVGNEDWADIVVSEALDRLEQALYEVFPDSIEKMLHALTYEVALRQSHRDFSKSSGQSASESTLGGAPLHQSDDFSEFRQVVPEVESEFDRVFKLLSDHADSWGSQETSLKRTIH